VFEFFDRSWSIVWQRGQQLALCRRPATMNLTGKKKRRERGKLNRGAEE
jgi:hypothetical protein